MLYLSDSSVPNLSVREFRELAWEHRREIEIAQVSMSQAFDEFASLDRATPEQCDLAMLSIQAFREIIQQFCSLLYMTHILPDSVWSMRYHTLYIFCGIDRKTSDILFQLRILRNVFQEPSEWVKEQQQQLRHDLDEFLEDSKASIANVNILVDQASFAEKRTFSQA